jgi:hypothetical protein
MPKLGEVEKAVKELTKALEVRMQAKHSIEWKGNKIVLPEYLKDIPDAIRALEDHHDQMEDDTTKRVLFVGHPHDTLHAFSRAVEETFGELIGSSHVVQSFFGPMKVPGQTRTITIGPNQEMTVPYGNVKVPGLPITMEISVSENKEDPMESNLIVDASYKAKFASLIEMIEEATHRWLRDSPIFTGKAIDSRFNFLNLDGFDVSKIVYSEQEERDLRAYVFSLIEDRQGIRDAGIDFKRSILLSGKYGTGKTLTAYLIARLCIEAGVTFMNVLPGDDITVALKFAKKFQPAVVFFEDVDQVTSGERDTSVNNILNTIDGLLSKNNEVMTILTTNHVDRLESAMRRPGRIDAILEIGHVDAQVLNGLIVNHCPDIDMSQVMVEELLGCIEGYTPAFVVEGCKRAVLYAYPENVITHDSLKDAFLSLRPQYELMCQEQTKDDVSIDSKLNDVVEGALDSVVGEKVTEALEEFNFFDAVREQ